MDDVQRDEYPPWSSRALSTIFFPFVFQLFPLSTIEGGEEGWALRCLVTHCGGFQNDQSSCQGISLCMHLVFSMVSSNHFHSSSSLGKDEVLFCQELNTCKTAHLPEIYPHLYKQSLKPTKLPNFKQTICFQSRSYQIQK